MGANGKSVGALSSSEQDAETVFCEIDELLAHHVLSKDTHEVMDMEHFRLENILAIETEFRLQSDSLPLSKK